ncbi:proteinase-activated receptor 3 isoform X1 [Girardinichthys multiradiatus]|uniref:proteinase-activated receptor 3 isoform X1 n=1 Tax=Girardinichthys multiradiatus TaxID=208333 RepID=UPI001FADA972|nr:proteinase-activated receptor 3 isoform X1 [Girardinichthys multiradiatus]
MANLLRGLLFCLVAAQTSQLNENRTKIAPPRSWKGSLNKYNYTNQLPDPFVVGTDPHLDVDPEGPVTAYTTGAISSWFIPLSYILTILVGIPSNTYILAFLRVKLSSKMLSTVVLNLNLALSDLLLVLSLALRVHYHLNANNWIFGEISCRLIAALFYGNVYCSAQTIACISVKRYLAVVKPFLYRRMTKTSLAVWMCLVVWFLYGAAIVPELLVRQSYYITKLGITTCHDVLPLEEPSHSLLVPYRLMLVFLGFLLPFMVCIYTHIAVVYHLEQSSCDWKLFIRASTLVFIIFVVCFFPSGILHAAHYIHLCSSGDDTLYGYYRLAICLCCFHSCLDPFLCMLLSMTANSELQLISFNKILQRPAVII